MPDWIRLPGARVSDTDTDRTHNFGMDGYFLDTLDTAGPYEMLLRATTHGRHRR